MKLFDKQGRLLIPLEKRKDTKPEDEKKIRYVIQHAYCPKGCNLIDMDHEINGFAGLRIKFKRPKISGEFIISAIEGDFDKIILSGNLEKGVKDELYCPHCGEMFKKLLNCNCQSGADMIVIGLTPKLDFNNAISFCNVTGCDNGIFVQAGEILKHIRLTEYY